MNNIPYDGCFECQYQCEIDCHNCLNGICQDQCNIGYLYINNQCITICGDGIIAGAEECEDYTITKNDNCKDCKLIFPQYCFECEYGNCKICNSGYNLDQKSNICILEQESIKSNLNFDECNDICNSESNILCQICKLSSQPYIILTYLDQIDNQQNILLTFSQAIKLQSDTSLIDHLNLQIIEDVNPNSYQINVIAVHDATNNQINNAEYQIKIDFNSSISEFHYLKVKVETTIINEHNIELNNYQQQIILLPYMQPSKNLITKSRQGQRLNQALSGSLGILAIISLIIGQSKVFQSILQILQFQSYLKFINIRFPYHILVYLEGNNFFQVSNLFSFLNIQQFTQQIIIPFESFQQSNEKILYYQINSDLFSNFKSQIYQVVCLIVSLGFMYFLQKVLQYLLKLQNITNLKVLRILFFLQRYAFNFIKSYHLQNLITLLRANSWIQYSQQDYKFHQLKITVNLSLQLALRNTVQDVIGYLIIYLCFHNNNFIFDNPGSKSQKQFWQSKHQSVILLQTLCFLIILIQLQYNKVMQILLLSTIQLIYLVYLFAIKPIKNKLELINSIQMEISILIFTLSSIFYSEMFSNLIDFENQIIIGWCQIFIFLSVLLIRILIEMQFFCQNSKIFKKICFLFQKNNSIPKANPHPLENKN